MLLFQHRGAGLQLNMQLGSKDAAVALPAFFSTAYFQPTAKTYSVFLVSHSTCDCRDFVSVTLSVLLVQKAVSVAGRVY